MMFLNNVAQREVKLGRCLKYDQLALIYKQLEIDENIF